MKHGNICSECKEIYSSRDSKGRSVFDAFKIDRAVKKIDRCQRVEIYYDERSCRMAKHCVVLYCVDMIVWGRLNMSGMGGGERGSSEEWK